MKRIKKFVLLYLILHLKIKNSDYERMDVLDTFDHRGLFNRVVGMVAL